MALRFSFNKHLVRRTRMKKMTSFTLVAAALISAMSISQTAIAEVSANVGATSNYVWRGVSQSADSASVSGGLDYANDSGFYASAWVGSLSEGNGAETDLILGYSATQGSFTYDVGYVYYLYTELDDSNFGEIYVNGSIDNFGFGIAYTVNSEVSGPSPFDTGDIYYSVNYSGIDLGSEFELALAAGYYTFDVSSELDYAHLQADITKGDFTFSISKAEEEGFADGDIKFIASWSTSF